MPCSVWNNKLAVGPLQADGALGWWHSLGGSNFAPSLLAASSSGSIRVALHCHTCILFHLGRVFTAYRYVAWLCTVLIESCTVVHYVSLLSCCTAYCFATVILLFHCHTALPPSYCFTSFTFLWLCHICCFAFVTLCIVCHYHVALFLSCCFAFVTLLCLCHAHLPLSCCFTSVVLLCLCLAVLPPSCCFASVTLLFLSHAAVPQSVSSVILFCLCHASLPVSYCFAPVILLQQHLCVSHFWLAWLNPASLSCHCMSSLSFCPARVMLIVRTYTCSTYCIRWNFRVGFIFTYFSSP